MARALVSNSGAGASDSDSMPDDNCLKLLRKLWNACVPGRLRSAHGEHAWMLCPRNQISVRDGWL